MGSYERTTTATIRDALATAEQFLSARIPIQKVAGDDHSVTMRGGDGTAVVSAHPHALSTVVTAITDQVRTSRLDIEVQHYMNQLPYQPGDTPGI
jgi:hypothetical protein